MTSCFPLLARADGHSDAERPGRVFRGGGLRQPWCARHPQGLPVQVIRISECNGLGDPSTHPSIHPPTDPHTHPPTHPSPPPPIHPPVHSRTHRLTPPPTNPCTHPPTPKRGGVGSVQWEGVKRIAPTVVRSDASPTFTARSNALTAPISASINTKSTFPKTLPRGHEYFETLRNDKGIFISRSATATVTVALCSSKFEAFMHLSPS